MADASGDRHENANFTLERDGRKAILTFTREDRLNALDAQTFRDLLTTSKLSKLTVRSAFSFSPGGGRAFVAGADITGYIDRTVLEYVEFQRLGRLVYDRLERLRQPVIAAVNGYALGGGFELVLVADLVVAAETATFGLPEAKLGLLPGGGGTQRLPRLVGRNKAKELLMTADFITATEARELGIVNRVVPAEELLPAAHVASRPHPATSAAGGRDGEATRQRRPTSQPGDRHHPGDGDDSDSLCHRRRAGRHRRLHREATTSLHRHYS